MSNYRWVVLAVGCLGTAVVGVLRQGLPALGPAFRDTFGLTLGEVGFVFGALAAGMTIGLVPWGALADRTGERPVLAGGLVLTTAALILAAVSEAFALLLTGLFLTGLFAASATGATGRAVMGWFGRAERGFVLGIRQTAIPLGGALAALTLPAVAVAAGLREALLALAGFTLVAAVAGAVWLRDPPPSEPPPGFSAPPPTRDPRIWRLGVGSGLFVVAQAAVIGFVVLFLHDDHGLGLGEAAAVLAAIQVASAIARIAIGRLSDRRGRRIAPLRGAGIAGGALVALAALLNDAPLGVLVPLLVLGGAAMSSWNGLSFTVAAEIAGRARAGTAMSLQNTLVSMLGAVASPLFGALAGATSFATAYLIIAAAPVLGWWVLRPLEDDEDERAEARARRLAAYAVES
ncbi:MAG TPA: MFS transporter [Solirubrobacteraceae bacterium]|nr:MFS transporter [Solirubrobacteraceae bacterium]